MKVAFYDGGAWDKTPRVEELDWAALAALLTQHRRSAVCAAIPCPDRKCPAKLGAPAWSPVDIVDRCLDVNVRSVTVGVFDLDHLKDSDTEVIGALQASGYAQVVYSTHSNNPPDDICLRLVVPLSRPVLPREWPAFWAAAMRELRIPGDTTCGNTSRIYFLPDCPVGSEAVAYQLEGRPLDVDGLLAVRAPPKVLAAALPPVPEEEAPAPTDVHELAGLLRQHARPENRPLISKVLRGEPFAPKTQRDYTLQKLMATVAFCLPNDTPEAAILHLLNPSFAATNAENPNDWPDGVEHLNREALKKLHKSRERKIARDAQRLAENQAVLDLLGLKPVPAGAPQAPLDEGEEDPNAWMGRLVLKDGRALSELPEGEEVKLLNREANVDTVLAWSPEWRGAIRFNEVTKEIECRGGPVNCNDPETLPDLIGQWFQRSPWARLGLTPPPAVVIPTLRAVAMANRYDPLQEQLERLVHDSKPRIDGLLETYFGAAGETRYLRAVSRRWLLSLVARALKPGCKVDTMLILEGPQGLRKSTAVEVLAQGFFSDASIDIRSKDTWALASQYWVLEFGELQGVRKSDVEQLKAFLSRRDDTYRPPYARLNKKAPRRAVFVGTTNAREYLQHDPSGYRRYWPVQCTSIDLEKLKQDAPQLLAEAVAVFKAADTCPHCPAAKGGRCADHRWWLEDDEALLAEEQSLERSEDAGGPDQVLLEWLLQQVPEKRTRLSTHEVAMQALQLQPSQISKSARMEVGSALRRLGFERKRPWVAGVQVYVYVAPAAIMDAPRLAQGQRPSPVTLAKPA